MSYLAEESIQSGFQRLCGASHIPAYLKWKIRQAEQGKVPVGPTRTRTTDGVERNFKVLSVRMESELVEKLDEAWQRHGLKSRMELFRASLQKYFASVGKEELVEKLVL